MKSFLSAKLYDSGRSYGWISIALHWTVTIAVITLWFIGDSVQSLPYPESFNARRLHIGLAASIYIIAIVRIYWRFRSGHPWLVGQSRFTHRLAKLTHYLLLISLALMLISGPIIVWSSGSPINIFDWFSIPSPWGYAPQASMLAHQVHSVSATILMLTLLLHMAGAFKHLMFNDDETFIRMLVPRKEPEENPQTGAFDTHDSNDNETSPEHDSRGPDASSS